MLFFWQNVLTCGAVLLAKRFNNQQSILTFSSSPSVRSRLNSDRCPYRTISDVLTAGTAIDLMTVSGGMFCAAVITLALGLSCVSGSLRAGILMSDVSRFGPLADENINIEG